MHARNELAADDTSHNTIISKEQPIDKPTKKLQWRFQTVQSKHQNDVGLPQHTTMDSETISVCLALETERTKIQLQWVTKTFKVKQLNAQ